jgi:aminoglycoside phosphotransferase (APT) family kinase protein
LTDGTSAAARLPQFREDTTVPSAIDRERYAQVLGRWLVDAGAPVMLPLRIGVISGGRSNLTLSADDAAGNRFVVRRPPRAASTGSAHDVLREAQILLALHPTQVPVPEVVASSDDTGLIGATFYVMRFVPGHVLTRPEDTAALTGVGEPGKTIADEAVRALAGVHDVDLDAVGLGHLRRPHSYVARQLRQFAPTVDAEDGPIGAQLRAVQTMLGALLPDEAEVGLLHGDFKLGNLIVGEAAEVRAVLDWELASVGDPVADLGWLVASWAEPSDGPWLVTPATAAGGFPAREEVADAYRVHSGRGLELLDYYVAFAFWRWSCINVRTRRRLLHGGLSNSTLTPERINTQIEWQLDRARAALAGLAP